MKISQSAAFQKELKKLSKKYKTLPDDLKILESLIVKFPRGEDSRHCNILKEEGQKVICKRRMMCRSLKGSEFRVIYYSDGERMEVEHIEIYYKGVKSTENKNRIDELWRKQTS
jgi:mRNA-degrading endonuclease RelE of RelBE toxin-antitoxin system